MLMILWLQGGCICIRRGIMSGSHARKMEKKATFPRAATRTVHVPIIPNKSPYSNTELQIFDTWTKIVSQHVNKSTNNPICCMKSGQCSMWVEYRMDGRCSFCTFVAWNVNELTKPSILAKGLFFSSIRSHQKVERCRRSAHATWK